MVLDFLETNSWSVILFLVAVSLLWLSIPQRPWGVPPGPRPLPIIGNLLYFLTDPRQSWSDLQSRYGDIYSLYMGHSLVVVLHSSELIRSAFLDHGDVTSNRPNLYVLQKIGRNKGLTNSSGLDWKEQRWFTVKTLKEFGLDRASVSDRIRQEILACMQEIDSQKGKPFDISKLLHTAVSNVICSVVFGERYSHRDPDFVSCLEKINENGHLIDATGVLNIFPSLQYLPGDPTNIHKVLSNLREILAFIRQKISQHKRTMDPQRAPRDFIDAYLKNFKIQQKVNPDTSFSEEQLTRVVADLFIAGTETTASILRWLILFLIIQPEVQIKVQREIDDIIGNDEPGISHRPLLPFLQAVVYETQRFADILPVGGPHAASSEFQLGKFYIPEGTIILPFLHGLHFHRSWGDPQNFRPERFLTSAGQLQIPDMFMPFSIGRRACIGESLAKMELFLFAASILKRYKLCLPKGFPRPNLQTSISHVVAPPPFQLCALPRTKQL